MIGAITTEDENTLFGKDHGILTSKNQEIEEEVPWPGKKIAKYFRYCTRFAAVWTFTKRRSPAV